MFSEKDDPLPKLGGRPEQGEIIRQAGCPVVRAYAQSLRSILPPSLLRDLEKREAAIAVTESSLEIQMARALHLAQHVVKERLPLGLAMFNFPQQADALRALPALSTSALVPQYLAAIQDVRATPWNPRDHGANMFRAALLRPLDCTEQALALLTNREPAQVGRLLVPAFERLGSIGDLLPLLDDLLKIGAADARASNSLDTPA